MKRQLFASFAGAIALVLITLCFYRCTKPAASAASNTATLPRAATITSFIHPAVLNTQASLDLVGGEVNSGNPTRSAAYQKVLDFANSAAYPTSFPSTVEVGSNGVTTPSKTQIRNDAELAYAYALRWAKSGEIANAQKCIYILDGWASNFTNYTVVPGSNTNQPSLEASWTTPTFVAAAEIIRYYKVNGATAGWTDAEISTFSNYLNLVKNNYINNMPTTYNNNWEVTAGYAKMAIGIFLNSTTVYQNGYNWITQYLPDVIYSDGTCPEECGRTNYVHFQYSLTALTYAAELANIQGDNSLYTTLNSRISAGYDFMRAAYDQNISCDYCTTSKPTYPGVEVAYGHYGTSNLAYLRGLQAPLGKPADNTFAGFTTYTHYNVPNAGL